MSLEVQRQKPTAAGLQQSINDLEIKTTRLGKTGDDGKKIIQDSGESERIKEYQQSRNLLKKARKKLKDIRDPSKKILSKWIKSRTRYTRNGTQKKIHRSC